MVPHSKDKQMRKHLEKCRESGMSYSAYSKANQISFHQLMYYKKKFFKRANTKYGSSQENSIIPVSIKESLSHEPQNNTIEIHHSNGFHLKVSESTNLNQIHQLLQVIKAVSC